MSSALRNVRNGGVPPTAAGGGGSDYYLHKKFKKMVATVTVTVEPVDPAGTSKSPSTTSTNRMVYKPKFRMKSTLKTAKEKSKVESSNSSAPICGPVPKIVESSSSPVVIISGPSSPPPPPDVPLCLVIRKKEELPTTDVNENDDNIDQMDCGGGGGGGTAGVKLHQPWLSPNKRGRTDKEPIEISQSLAVPQPPAIEIRQLNLSPISLRMAPSQGSVGDSPNSKLFSELGLDQLSARKPQAEFRQPSGAQTSWTKDKGKVECKVCGKVFTRASQLTLHMNVHYIERPFRCDPCGVSFKTKGHLIKHRRLSSHNCKVNLIEAFGGVPNQENPRPFKCADCNIAFRIHGHLAKHLRSKLHIMRMECLGKLPFGIYCEMEKSGVSLSEIDTTDCDMCAVSLENIAEKIYGDKWRERLIVPMEAEPPS